MVSGRDFIESVTGGGGSGPAHACGCQLLFILGVTAALYFLSN